MRPTTPRSYGASQPVAPTTERIPTDPRYRTRRWARIAKRVRHRDGRCLVVPGCPRGAQVADHIVPVHPGMPDAQFYAESNLRGACYYHNTLRGQQAKAARELDGAVLSTEPHAQERRLGNLSPFRRSRSAVITRDYSAAPASVAVRGPHATLRGSSGGRA